jgi:DNA-binding NarL/FixJ family response regulator
MSQPVLFVIDDNAGVLGALRDDLGHRFGDDFRVVAEVSAAAGLEILRRLADRREAVALLIVDHDMSEMPGVDFLARDMHFTRWLSEYCWWSVITRPAAQSSRP